MILLLLPLVISFKRLIQKKQKASICLPCVRARMITEMMATVHSIQSVNVVYKKSEFLVFLGSIVASVAPN